MKNCLVVAGLGNPGKQYHGTRHNCGFVFVDLLREKAEQAGNVQEIKATRFSGEAWRISLPELPVDCLLVKPQTFMNASGQCIQPLLAWYNIPIKSLVVVHDELDLLPGNLRFKFAGGNAGHNGLKSIESSLGSNEFYRLRIGIGHPEGKIDVLKWVLTSPKAEEAEKIAQAMQNALSTFICFAKDGLQVAATFAKNVSQTDNIYNIGKSDAI